MTTLLTGATGFVGGELLSRLLARGEDVVAVVRRPEDAARLRAAGARPVVRDLTDPRLHLPPADTIVHCAASVSFALPLDEARAINLDGTRAVIHHAARHDARLVHVSTAYVAGRRRGVFREAPPDLGVDFRNTYEQTKAEAELLVHTSGVDAVILRPSIVVGDSRTGRTSAFNVLYGPLRAYARGLVTAIPARRDARVDVVPVDYVADAIAHVATELGAMRGTMHLVAGRQATTVGELVRLAATTLDREPPVLLAPDGEARAAVGAYLPYFDVDVIFDDCHARQMLAPARITPPPLRDYFARLVAYAEEAEWGKRRVA
jgi:nucleoside-diphosphate-sugar epimerase